MLVVLFGAVGLVAVVGCLDAVLFPAPGFFVLLTTYARSRRQKHNVTAKRGDTFTAGCCPIVDLFRGTMFMATPLIVAAPISFLLARQRDVAAIQKDY